MSSSVLTKLSRLCFSLNLLLLRILILRLRLPQYLLLFLLIQFAIFAVLIQVDINVQFLGGCGVARLETIVPAATTPFLILLIG